MSNKHNAGCDHARQDQRDEVQSPIKVPLSYALCKRSFKGKEKSIHEHYSNSIDQAVQNAARIIADATDLWSRHNIDDLDDYEDPERWSVQPQELHEIMDIVGLLLKSLTAAFERQRDEQLKKLRVEFGYGVVGGETANA